MAIRVSEREHFSRVLRERILSKADELYAPMKKKVREQASKNAITTLKLAPLLKQRAQKQKAYDKAEKELEAMNRKVLARADQVAEEEISEYSCQAKSNEEYDMSGRTSSQRETEEKKLLKKTPKGRRILALRKEADNVQNSVWLATSAETFSQLWAQVNKLIGAKDSDIEEAGIKLAK